MNVCDMCDIVYLERKCPLCIAAGEIARLEAWIGTLEAKLEESNAD